jgi:hypothetical protein
VSAYYHICVLIYYYMCPRTTTYVSSYYCICVGIPRVHSAGAQVRCFSVPGVPADAVPFVNIEAPGHETHTAIYLSPHTTMYLSSCMCPHNAICVSASYYVSAYYCMCPHTTVYVSAHYYVCVLILLHVSAYYSVCTSKLVDIFDMSRDVT